jgi:hypothetical protein
MRMRDKATARGGYEDAVGVLCRDIDELRALLPLTPRRWQALLAVLHDDTPDSDAWRDAVRALDDAAEAAGIPGGLGLSVLQDWPRREVEPGTLGWACPARRCSRVVLPTAPTLGPAASPRCALFDQDMRAVGG